MLRLVGRALLLCIVGVWPAAAQTPVAPPILLLDNQSADETTSTPMLVTGTACTVNIDFSAGTTGGTVTVEEAGRADYPGTWTWLADEAWISASRNHTVHINAVVVALRVRISAAIGGGTIDATGTCR